MGTESAYEEIRKVIEDSKYFFKVKKYAIKRLSKMLITHTTQSISAERYLLDSIKKSRYDQKLNCYKSNIFDDIPEYYLIKHCIKYASRPREDNGGKSQDEVILVDSSKICDAILKLLRENDSSRSKLDDGFYLKNVYESLGKAATYAQLGTCLNEFKKCLKLEKIIPSYNHSRTAGAVKGINYLHMSKSTAVENELQKEFSVRIKEINQLIKLMEEGIKNKIIIQTLYSRKIKRIFYKRDFIGSIKEAINNVNNLISLNKVGSANLYLIEIVRRVHKICKKDIGRNKLFFKDPSVVELLWSLLSNPIGNLSIDYLYSIKQIYWLLFKEKVPTTHRDEYKSLCREILDEEWMKVITEDFDYAVDLENEKKYASSTSIKIKIGGNESPIEFMNDEPI